MKKREGGADGFTIIEVLIVLALAGLILLIVFFSVPALQRNSRNNSYRREAAQLLTAAGEHYNNRNATLPSPSVSTTANTDAATIVGLTKNKNISVLTVEAEAGVSTPAANTFGSAILRTRAKCNATANETDPGGVRAFAILYNVENGSGGSTLVCVQS